MNWRLVVHYALNCPGKAIFLNAQGDDIKRDYKKSTLIADARFGRRQRVDAIHRLSDVGVDTMRALGLAKKG